MSNLLPIVVEDHLLWPDGTISVDPSLVVNYMFRLSSRDTSLEKLYVTSITPEILAYNNVSDHKLKVKTDCTFNKLSWKLPEKYQKLDLDDYLIKLVERIEHDELYEKRVERLSNEIFLFGKLELEEVLRVLIYSIDTMREKNVIWGVGRGSSCSSYLLFLLGLHEVDAVKFEIDIGDFLK